MPQVSEPPPKVSVLSMGEMTTADPTSRPSAEDAKHTQPPRKPALTEAPASSTSAEAAPRDDSLMQQQAPATPSADALTNPQGRVEGAQAESAKAGPEEPMELGLGHCLGAATAKTADSQSGSTSAEKEALRTGPELSGKVPESSHNAELSLEELSISSKQQQLQSQSLAAKGLTSGSVPTSAHSVSERRPRKRKLLDDVESGKTLLLDAYRVWQQGQKVMTYDLGRIEKIMSETYMLIKQVSEKRDSLCLCFGVEKISPGEVSSRVASESG